MSVEESEYGEFFSEWTGDSQQLRIVRADPKILVAAELLDQIRDGAVGPYVTLDGDVLRIRGVNRTVVYRITGHDADLRIYYAEWPD